MVPKIASAETQAVFCLNGGYVASLLEGIESAGIIQYHHLLVVYSPDQQPCLFVGSEWSKLDPSYKNVPILGVFTNAGHQGRGGSPDWLDDSLFVLRAIEIARTCLSLTDEEMCEAEGWAMARILAKLGRGQNDPDLDLHRDSYRAALARYDSKLVAYLKNYVDAVGSEAAIRAAQQRLAVH